MDTRATGNVVLLPIKPRYANLIMNGTKKVEFRKTRFRKDVSHVVVYASSPVQKVLGYFKVSHMDEGSPQDLWTRHGAEGGIASEDFWEYYSSAPVGLAIGVGPVTAFRQPLPMKCLGPAVAVPQSFAYISHDSFARIAGNG